MLNKNSFKQLPNEKGYFGQFGGRYVSETLMPLILGKEWVEEFAYSETGNPLNDKRPPKEPNTRSIRNSKWKMIDNMHNGKKEIYDLENDPFEIKNLIDIETDVEKELWKELEKIRNNF